MLFAYVSVLQVKRGFAALPSVLATLAGGHSAENAHTRQQINTAQSTQSKASKAQALRVFWPTVAVLRNGKTVSSALAAPLGQKRLDSL